MWEQGWVWLRTVNLRALCCLLLGLTACSIPVDDSEFRVAIEARDDFRVVTIGSEPFAEYDCTSHRFPVVYPVHGPTGAPMTRHFPMRRDVEGEAHDHPHHRSLWFAHGAVNGHDFWHGKNNRVVHRAFLPVDDLESERVIHTRNEWMARDVRICSDERRIVFGGDATTRTIDYTVTIHATDGDVVFGDTKEGTMALRVAAPLRLRGDMATGSMRNSEGHTGKKTWGKRARWVAYDGTIQAQKVGLALLDHVDNPRHPTWWHARDYGLVAANPYGVHDFERKPKGTGDFVVKAGESVTWRYRVWMFVGDADEVGVQEEWERFVR